MFNSENYYSKTKDINFSTFPEALQKGHAYVGKVTGNGSNWETYRASATIKSVIDTYFTKLSDYLGKQVRRAQPETQKTKKGKASAAVQAEQDIKEYGTTTTDGLKRLLQLELQKQKKSGKTTVTTRTINALRAELDKRKHRNAKPSKKQQEKYPAALVEKISEELRFIRRFVNLNGKVKTKEDILRFVNSLQKSILEKKIRKTSQYAEQIKFIQQKLIDTFNSMGKQVKIELKESTYEALKTIVGDEQMLQSVGFIKRYINLNGKPGMKDKAKLLLGQINRAYEKGKINDSDPYIVEMHEIKNNLEYFISNKTAKTLDIEPNTLNGLQGIADCGCTGLNGVESSALRLPSVMNSMDFADLQFQTIGLQGKWREFIGDPSSNFTAMVFGRPKMGKSHLCMDFGGYLARNHGEVLYVAKEEGLDKTLQDKLNSKDIKHPNLFVASILPADLSMYDFIFLDSVNKLGLKPEDLNRLKASYPGKSFIYVFQTTKDGSFRGPNTFQHDVDVVVDVPERGKAVQFGRFNQGGEMDIFEPSYAAAA